MSLKISCVVDTYDGTSIDEEKVDITSFVDNNQKIIMTVNEKTVVVFGRELIAAVENCMSQFVPL